MTAVLTHFYDALLTPMFRMGLTAAFVAVVVFLLRLVLKNRAPRKVLCLLWLLVFARLLLPVTFHSSLSLVPQLDNTPVAEEQQDPLPSQTIMPTQSATPPVQSAPPVVSPPAVSTQRPVTSAPVENIPPVTQTSPPVVEEPPAEPEPAPIPLTHWLLPAIWLAGVAVMVVYAVASYLRLRRSVYAAIRVEKGVWEHSSLRSPFILGLFRPKIYLPMGLDGRTRDFILRHEKAHLHRLDHVVKPICWVALALHWYNPFAWAAFLLMSRDMEAACDQQVIDQLGTEIKADYSAALLDLATGGKFPAPSPLSFGEGDARSRIKTVLNFKKPSLWITIVAIVVVIAAAVTLLTDRKAAFDPDDYITDEFWPGLYFQTTPEENSSSTTTKAYRLEGDNLELVAGYRYEILHNYDILIHPDGTEEPIFGSTAFIIQYEQYLAEAVEDPAELGGLPLTLPEDAPFTVRRTPLGNALILRDGQPHVAWPGRTDFFDRHDVSAQVCDLDGDGEADDLALLSKYDYTEDGDQVYEDALLLCLWTDEGWVCSNSAHDLPYYLDLTQYAGRELTVPVATQIRLGPSDPADPLPGNVALLENCTLDFGPRITELKTGGYLLTYTARNAEGIAVAEVRARLAWDNGRFYPSAENIIALTIEADPGETPIDPSWELLTGVEGFGQIYRTADDGTPARLIAVSGDYQTWWLAEEFYSAGFRDLDTDGVNELCVHSSVGAGGAVYDILTVLEPDGDSWTERALHGLSMETYTGNFRDLARFSQDGNRLTMHLLDFAYTVELDEDVMAMDGDYYADQTDQNVRILLTDRGIYVRIYGAVRRDTGGNYWEDVSVGRFCLLLRADYRDGVYQYTPLGIEECGDRSYENEHLLTCLDIIDDLADPNFGACVYTDGTAAYLRSGGRMGILPQPFQNGQAYSLLSAGEAQTQFPDFDPAGHVALSMDFVHPSLPEDHLYFILHWDEELGWVADGSRFLYPDNYEVLNTWQADLTYDGKDETIMLIGFEQYGETYRKLLVWQGSGLLMSKELHRLAHTLVYSLYSEGGRDYLLEWQDGTHQGYGILNWQVFSFPSGRLTVDRSDRLEYDATNPDALKAINMDQVYGFEEKVRPLLDAARLLAGVHSDDHIRGDSELSTVWQWEGIYQSLKDRRDYYIARLPEYDLTITTGGSDGRPLLHYGGQTRELDTVISSGHMRDHVEFFPTDRNNDGQEEIVILYWMGGGTGFDEWGLMAVWLEDGEIQIAYHDWKPLAQHFDANNSFSYDADNKLVTVNYNGQTAYVNSPEGDPTETAPGHELGEALFITGNIVRYESAGEGTWTLTMIPSPDNGYVMYYIGTDVAWNIGFDGTKFVTLGSGYLPDASQSPSIDHPAGPFGWSGGIVTKDTLPDDPDQYYLVAELPEENIYLYAKDKGRQGLLYFEGSLTQVIDRTIYTSLDVLPTMFMAGDYLMVIYPVYARDEVVRYGWDTGGVNDLFFAVSPEAITGNRNSSSPRFVMVMGNYTHMYYQGKFHDLGGRSLGLDILDSRLYDIDQDGRSEVVVIGTHDGNGGFAMFSVLEQSGDTWQCHTWDYTTSGYHANGSNVTFNQIGDTLNVHFDGPELDYSTSINSLFQTAEGTWNIFLPAGGTDPYSYVTRENGEYFHRQLVALYKGAGDPWHTDSHHLVTLALVSRLEYRSDGTIVPHYLTVEEVSFGPSVYTTLRAFDNGVELVTMDRCLYVREGDSLHKVLDHTHLADVVDDIWMDGNGRIFASGRNYAGAGHIAALTAIEKVNGVWTGYQFSEVYLVEGVNEGTVTLDGKEGTMDLFGLRYDFTLSDQIREEGDLFLESTTYSYFLREGNTPYLRSDICLCVGNFRSYPGQGAIAHATLISRVDYDGRGKYTLTHVALVDPAYADFPVDNAVLRTEHRADSQALGFPIPVAELPITTNAATPAATARLLKEWFPIYNEAGELTAYDGSTNFYAVLEVVNSFGLIHRKVFPEVVWYDAALEVLHLDGYDAMVTVLGQGRQVNVHPIIAEGTLDLFELPLPALNYGVGFEGTAEVSGGKMTVTVPSTGFTQTVNAPNAHAPGENGPGDGGPLNAASSARVITLADGTQVLELRQTIPNNAGQLVSQVTWSGSGFSWKLVVVDQWVEVSSSISPTSAQTVVTLPSSMAERTRYNSTILDVAPFTLGLDLPNGWTVLEAAAMEQAGLESYSHVSGIFSIQCILNEKGEPVGSIGYNLAPAVEAGTREPMALFAGITLARHYFDCKDNFSPVLETNTRLVAVTDVVYNADWTDAAYPNHGILVRDEDLGIYVAIEIDRNALTRQQIEIVAASLTLQKN